LREEDDLGRRLQLDLAAGALAPGEGGQLEPQRLVAVVPQRQQRAGVLAREVDLRRVDRERRRIRGAGDAEDCHKGRGRGCHPAHHLPACPA
jgi:hypothetical protein